MSTDVTPAVETITVTIDGIEVTVPKGTLAIRAAEAMGIVIPRFCDHPLLDPAGACRQCIVEVPDMGNGRPNKPQASCTLELAPGMKINTQVTSPVARKAQEGMLELLLINHPLDCPICDKGGECPLQNQAHKHGPAESRYEGVKRTYPKPINISALILLDRERCVLCQRCTRFSTQIAGDPFISLLERGAVSQIGIEQGEPYHSFFSGNVIQICPVGALTSADYRFRARPFDLVSTRTTCEHCASGCELRTDHRHYKVLRRMAGDDPAVNEEWNCDKGRFGFAYGTQKDRITMPYVRRDGELVEASWPEAIDAAVEGLQRVGSSVGVLTGGRLSVENAYAYSRFARAVLGTNNIDFRARAISDEETAFLTGEVAATTAGELGVTYDDLEAAKQVVLVGFEPENESPIVFLRLRKAWRKKKVAVLSVAPFLSRGATKMGAQLVPTLPGDEAAALEQLVDEGRIDADTIILVGERAATSPGALAEVVAAKQATGARYAWVPRRAGEIGAIKAGCLPGLLPFGRPAGVAEARVDVAATWGVDSLPTEAGLDTLGMIAAAAAGELAGLVVAGVEVADLPNPELAREALSEVFVVSIEQRVSEASQYADVILPAALIDDQIGTFVNWEGRERPINLVRDDHRQVMSDVRILAALADALGSELGFRSPAQAADSLDELGVWRGARPATDFGQIVPVDVDGMRLSTWRVLVDDARGLDGADALLATAPLAQARLSAATAAAVGVREGEIVTVSTEAGAISLPVDIVDDMLDGAVWLPMRSTGSLVHETLHAVQGDVVSLSRGGAQ